MTTWSKAVITTVNPNVIQARGDRVAIGFPTGSKQEVFIFQCENPGLVRDNLLEWLSRHLKANGVEFDVELDDLEASE